MRIDENTHVPLRFLAFVLGVITPCTIWFVRLEGQAAANSEAIATFNIKEDKLLFELRQIDRRLSRIEGSLRKIDDNESK